MRKIQDYSNSFSTSPVEIQVSQEGDDPQNGREEQME